MAGKWIDNGGPHSMRLGGEAEDFDPVDDYVRAMESQMRVQAYEDEAWAEIQAETRDSR
ncbi:MAG: hypothetical protein JO362_14265 [Streptomycetaceae bacterium]|nr:hypothetical protein [Streptomycetaceae bacterium]